MKMINEQEIFETWSPIIEAKTGIKDSNKIEWLSKYCHYHSLNEDVVQQMATRPSQTSVLTRASR
jgi:hypothetical protein